MKTTAGALPLLTLALAWPSGPLAAADGTAVLAFTNQEVRIKVAGDKDDDWWIERSTNLATWTTLTNLGTLLSGNETNAAWRSLGAPGAGPVFYRARQTAGLYDPTVFRTISLTFTQANWTNAMHLARQYDSNIHCSPVSLDNGATNFAVGARYKGNTSYTQPGTKKSINLEFDWLDPDGDLMNYTTVNLNNAKGDETIMREPLFLTIMSQYTPAPKGAMANVFVNGAQWGVYSLIQQENKELIKEWFPSNDGDRWRAPNAPVGGFASSNSAFAYFGHTNVAGYTNHYILKNTRTTTNAAYARLVRAIYILNTTPTNQLRDALEDTWAVDNWLWHFALGNLLVDDDSYWQKGADYGFYYEVESGRIHPLEHDANESFAAIGGINFNLPPTWGMNTNNRPLLRLLLQNQELRQRYLAHMRTVIEEWFNPPTMTAWINQFHRLSVAAILTDPNRGYTPAAYTNDLIALRTYVTNRYNFLLNHPDLTPARPAIQAVNGPATNVFAGDVPFVTATVVPDGTSGLSSVWLYFRPQAYGKFTRVPMLDDGAHGDGAAGDGVFGAATTNYPAGTKVRYYVEARGSNVAQAARFAPARAENVTYSYRVLAAAATTTPVIINEFMADNATALADPQGQFDDWIELHNVTDAPVDLTGRYLSDNPANPRKWAFPAGTTIPANGYLLVWADEDGGATPGLHANFKLSKAGEQILLVDTDANLNRILDSITFGPQTTDLSYGRTAANADVWAIMNPTPGAPNQ